MPLVVPLVKDKRIQKHGNKINKTIMRNNGLAKAVVDLCKCNYLKGMPDLALKAMPMMEEIETRSSSDTHKVK